MLIEPSQVVQRLSLGDKGAIVLTSDPNTSRNIFLVRPSGEVIWQIEEPVHSDGVQRYYSVYLNGAQLFAYSANGVEYLVDSETGRIQSKELIR